MNIELHHGDLPDTVSFGPILAMDTEAMGLHPKRDRLCLAQMTDGSGTVHLVKFGTPPLKAPNFAKVLTDKNILKLYHFARFDIALLKAYLGVDVSPVYCTKIASKLTRTFTDRHGLKDLVKEFTGVDLSKQQQTSDWGTETLTQAQLEYAASDVVHLHKLKEGLDRLLEREGRTRLAKACFDFLPARAELDLLDWAEEDVFAH
ncbi:MAG: ribonuclease H-like domain-containing protein [Alphaproteobacteria bacterium]